MHYEYRSSTSPTIRPLWVVFLLTFIGLILTACDGDGQPTFSLPIDCVPGESCWVVVHMDVDPGPDAKDYTCGYQTFDGSSGTLFAIRDLATMRAGVAVRAAASGVVERIRDGMRDVDYGPRGSSGVKDRSCGNAVRIDHGSGWSSLYCHLRRGSVRVRKGQKVESNDIIGSVGMSGRTNAPQLFFHVYSNGKAVDPFTGRTEPTTCDGGGEPLWTGAALDAMPYQPIKLYNVGIASRKPTARYVRNQGAKRSKTLSRSLSLSIWVDMFNVEKDDTLHFALTGPGGESIVSRTVQLHERRLRQFYFVGKRRKSKLWAPGTYKGTVTLTRRTPNGNIRESVSTEALMR